MTIEEMRERCFESACNRDFQGGYWFAQLQERRAIKEAVLDIAEQIWCEAEGWHEIVDEYVSDIEWERLAIFHPPTNGGWVMVPVELPIEMKRAASGYLFIGLAEVCWRDMLASAPSAPVGG